MSKMEFYKQAERMYVYEKQLIDAICKNLNISRRTLFYWKKEYNWDKKRFDIENNKQLFNRELLEFARKVMHKISSDIDNNLPTSQAEMYSLMNILKNIPQFKQNKSGEISKSNSQLKFLSPRHIKQIERDILGME